MAKPRPLTFLGRRKQDRRQRFDRVLIVCEGEKSETRYLDELCRTLRLPGVHIVGRGAGPAAVWKRAQEEFARDRDYDRVVCVFDRDTHQDYARVLAEISQHIEAGRIGNRRAGGTVLMPVPSNPCFEFWLLLHFQTTTAAFTGPHDVLARLHRCDGMADYRKNQVGLFGRLRPRLETAIANARHVRQQVEANGADEPLTEFDRLIEYMLEQEKRHAPVR